LCLDCSAWHLTHLKFWQVINSDAARRMVAEQQAREIEQDEEAYLRQRLAEIAYEIGRPARELAEARQACAKAVADLRRAYANDKRWQRQVLKELGL
jgi:signal transduction protein with GAF and PtsI domain